MDNDHGLGHYLLAGGDSNTQMRNNNELSGAGAASGGQGLLSQQQDDDNMVAAQLILEMNNIKETQMQYGMPAIGDLFKARPQDVQETINSVYYMLKQRIQDIESRTEFR